MTLPEWWVGFWHGFRPILWVFGYFMAVVIVMTGLAWVNQVVARSNRKRGKR
jgi:hypothetical protein